MIGIALTLIRGPNLIFKIIIIRGLSHYVPVWTDCPKAEHHGLHWDTFFLSCLNECSIKMHLFVALFHCSFNAGVWSLLYCEKTAKIAAVVFL